MSAATSTDTPAKTSHGAFLRSRLGSILAVAPLGVWTVDHLWNNLSAFRGAAAWEHAVIEYEHPLAFFFCALLALLPLALHTVWGIGRLFTARPNGYRTFGNLRYWLQRLSAIGVLAFLGAHLWLALIHPRMTTGYGEPFHDIAHEMNHHLPTLVVYLLGTLGVAYHLANGLHGVAMGWGLATTRRALDRLQILVFVTFAALLAMSWAAIYALWDAGA